MKKIFSIIILSIAICIFCNLSLNNSNKANADTNLNVKIVVLDNNRDYNGSDSIDYRVDIDYSSLPQDAISEDLAIDDSGFTLKSDGVIDTSYPIEGTSDGVFAGCHNFKTLGSLNLIGSDADKFNNITISKIVQNVEDENGDEYEEDINQYCISKVNVQFAIPGNSYNLDPNIGPITRSYNGSSKATISNATFLAFGDNGGVNDGNTQPGNINGASSDRIHLNLASCDANYIDQNDEPAMNVGNYRVLIKSCQLEGFDKNNYQFISKDFIPTKRSGIGMPIEPKYFEITKRQISIFPFNFTAVIKAAMPKITATSYSVSGFITGDEDNYILSGTFAFKSTCNTSKAGKFTLCVINSPNNPFKLTPKTGFKDNYFLQLIDNNINYGSLTVTVPPCVAPQIGTYPNCYTPKPPAQTITPPSNSNSNSNNSNNSLKKSSVETLLLRDAIDGLEVGQTYNVGLNIEISPDNYSIGKINYSSSKPHIASISTKGLMIARRVGVTKITISFYDNVAKKVFIYQKKISVTTPNIPKSDVPKLNDISKLLTVRQTAIKWMAKKGITVCVNKKGKVIYKCKYNPLNQVNRGAMSEFMYKMAGYPSMNGQTIYFSTQKDVKALKKVLPTRYKTISWLANQKIVSKTAKFKPGKTLTRAEMAVWMYRLSDKPAFNPSATLKKKFSDVKSTDKSETTKAIWWIASKNITVCVNSKGKIISKCKFNLKNPVNRGSMSEFLMKLYNILIDPMQW